MADPSADVPPGGRVKQLFVAAMDLDGAARDAFVEQECRDDEGLRGSLERLLRAHDDAGDFLTHPATLIEAAAADACDPEGDDDGLEPGDRLGACELRERIARGGFGSVWRARQLHPVERDVALKILRRRDATAAAELVAERQTLARMQHPGIASMFDAGATEDGRPWLTMELVDGEPITRYCEAHSLSVAARLELFVALCAAVQHAHGKGFVHLDLKPGNVLVTERDGVASPVVIDFGIARALAGTRGDPDTGGGRAFGTPDYMSPEQAERRDGALDATDARSDVYSLGVLLQELVTGRRPGTLGTNGAHGMPRDVAWIVRRATAEQPLARYQAAAALADDVRRALSHEPVAAGPDTFSYRFGCLVRRHRTAAVAALMVVLALSVGGAVAAAGWWQASLAEQQARADQARAEQASHRANRALDLLDELWSRADPSRLGSADYPASQLLVDSLRGAPSRLGEEPEIELRVRRTMAGLQRFLGDLDDARAHADRAVELARAVDDRAQLSHSLVQRAMIEVARGDLEAAERDAHEAREGTATLPFGDVLGALVDTLLADCAQQRGELDEALELVGRSLEARRRIGHAAPIAQSLLRVANLHGAVGRVDPALRAVDEAIALQRDLGDDHPDVITAVQHRAFLLLRRGDLDGAERGFRDSLARRLRVYGKDHHEVAWAQVDLAWLLHERGRDAEAEPLLRMAIPVLGASFGDGHVLVCEARQRLGTVLMVLGHLDEAEVELDAAVAGLRRLTARGPECLVGALGNLAALHWRQGRRDDAVRGQREAIEHASATLPAEHFVLTVGMANLAVMLEQQGESEQALTLLREARERAASAGRAGEAETERALLEKLLRRLGRDDEADRLGR